MQRPEMIEARHKWRAICCADNGDCPDTPDDVFEYGYEAGYAHLESQNKSLLEEINCLRSVIAEMCTEIEELGGTGSPCFFTQWTRAEELRMEREK